MRRTTKPRAPRAARQPTEAQLHLAVAQYLDAVLLPPTWWSTIPLGGGGRIRGAQLKARGVKAGIPDILILHEGRLYGLELKVGYGKQSLIQLSTEREMLDAGMAGSGVAKSIDQVSYLLDFVFRIPTRQAPLLRMQARAAE